MHERKKKAMKEKMLKLCKKHKAIIVRYMGGRKFLSDGRAIAYIGDIAPAWTDVDFAIDLQLTDDEREGFNMEYIGEDVDSGEIKYKRFHHCVSLRYSLNMDGMAVQPFLVDNGAVIFIDMKYLHVFKDICPKRYYFDASMLYIVVNEQVMGAIAPMRIQFNTMKDFCIQLTSGVQKTEQSGLFGQDEQISLL